MRNKYLSLVALAAAAMATSCSTDELTEQKQQPNEGQAVTLTASVGNNTRVGMGRTDGNKVAFYWHAGDQISVQTQSTTGDNTYANTVFKIADDTKTGASTATFNGTVDAGYDVATYALYPYNADHQFDKDGGISYSFPTSYKYQTVEGNIFSKDGTYPSNSTCMPMLGTIADEKISFQHLGGLLVIRIDKMPSANGFISVTADQQLSGHFAIGNDLSGNPVILTTHTMTTADKQVTFSYSNATKGSAGVFYLPVAKGEYFGLKIQLYDENNVAIGSAAEYDYLTVDRADIITIPVYQSADGYSCTYEVNGHKFIDLCLPSGTLWAETNVGATNAADYGSYFAWGEVETKSDYRWATYKYGTSENLTKYNSSDSRTVLDKEDDAAYMNWGVFCRMPTCQEFTELCNTEYCTGTLTSKTASDGTTSIKGYEVTSKKNGKSIFLPAAGYAQIRGYADRGNLGYYWSSTPYGSNKAYQFYFENGYKSAASRTEYENGQSVRPVAKPYNSTVPDLTISGMDSGWE